MAIFWATSLNFRVPFFSTTNSSLNTLQKNFSKIRNRKKFLADLLNGEFIRGIPNWVTVTFQQNEWDLRANF